MKIIAKSIYRLRFLERQKIVREMEKNQWLSFSEIKRNSDALTQKLVVHSAANTLYYSRLFELFGISPEDMDFNLDWNRIPVLTKDVLRHQYKELISNSFHAKKARINHTGGSTGKPVQFLTDNSQYIYMAAWMDFVTGWAGWRPGDLRLEFWGNSDRRLPLNRYELFKASITGNYIIPVYNYTEEKLAQWFSLLMQLKPAVIYGYPSVLADFAKWIDSAGVTPCRVKGIFVSAEILFPEQRRTIERVFDCKVYNQYGSRETPCVACECPAGGMHLFIDLNRVETEPTGDDKNVPLLITPLLNYAQPLLKYEIGDLGNIHHKSCECGRGYPLIDINVARSRDFFISSSGEKFYPGFFTRQMDGREWVRAFQFVQREYDWLELFVVTDSSIDRENYRLVLTDEIGTAIRKTMGKGVWLDVMIVDEIPRTLAGKHRYVVNLMSGANECAAGLA